METNGLEHPNLSLPGNPRYQPAELIPYFGYDNLYRPVAEVEFATLDVLHEIGFIPDHDMDQLTREVRERIRAITTTAVDQLERTVTHHDLRAWVRIAQDMLPENLRRWLHFPLTSYDALDTARALMFVNAYQNVTNPRIAEVVQILTRMVRQYADTTQIGRSHGQHALPIKVGFWLATILNRVLYNWKQIDQCAEGIVGKLSGAVGACNAQYALGVATACKHQSFEERVLGKLGLKPGPISTQIVQPEPLAYFLHAHVMLSGALGQLGRDCRHLMRTEIGEVREEFAAGQVGSSTMAHKRNPVNFENLEGMWLRTGNEYHGVLDTLISEHQRDLVGSSLMRDFPIIVLNVHVQLGTLLRRKDKGGPTFLERLSIDTTACERNLEMQGGLVMAEPLYLALQMYGYEGDGHRLVNETLVPIAQKQGVSLIKALEQSSDDEVKLAWAQVPEDIKSVLEFPEDYTGNAAHAARAVAEAAEDYLFHACGLSV
jgi:adenylosuccinate lyase